MSKLMLIDGNAIMHRAYHAMPPFKTPNGEPIGAVHGFVSMLFKAIGDLKPSHIALAFDRHEPTFRKKILKEYQAHRPEMDNELIPQFEKAKKAAQALGIPVFDKAGFEADDIIGTLSKKAEVDEVVILTGDRDLLQLVNNKTKLYMPAKGLANTILYGKKETEERLGVPPEQVVDFKALTGDPSDNYKGVPGIGPKTAQSLLKKHTSLKNVYKNLDEVSEKIAKLLREHQNSAFQSQELAKIVTDVELDFSLEKAKLWRVNSPQAKELFAEFGFRTLPKRADKLARELEEEKQMSLV